MYNFEALNESDRLNMLSSVGIKTMDEIFDIIPSEAKMKELNLDDGADEILAQKNLKNISKMNNVQYLNFLGLGSRNRYVPSLINDIASRFEFLSCYTPYQAEISQGSLRSMYEFQSAICTIVNQDVSNASVYDGASACAEAILMAVRLSKKNKVFIYDDINPNYLEVIKTYLWANDIEIIIGKETNDLELAAQLYQTPNKYGELIDMPQKNAKELIISCVDLFALAMYEPPASDITVGDIQSFGIGMNFGGAYGGFVACRDAYKRQLPGRISGKTVDKNGKEAYCLTLQAREQHIRREKATSNICSNQALVAFCANLYIRKLGKTGFKNIAKKSYENAHLLAKKLQECGFEIKNKEFFDEFTLDVGNSEKFLEFMKEKNILAGVMLDKNNILVSVTELNDIDEINQYVDAACNLSLAKLAI
ncbi:MAG: aminomethyl-transferring glycine dehydrogenase subunit GcvPA [Candidatus Gastranaerophilales bacterium]|nr:aminomethyl-transferring glycine dehydrogenase subunit GcvPA [Candidatus Gastranaerophilales bacterium]